MEAITSIGQDLVSGVIVITIALAMLKWLLKKQIDDLFNSIKSTQKSVVETKTELIEIIKENDKKTDERITKLEEYTHQEIGNVKDELNHIKGDFATMFVLREDFFRFGNRVENKMQTMDQKMDKLIIMVSERKGRDET